MEEQRSFALAAKRVQCAAAAILAENRPSDITTANNPQPEDDPPRILPSSIEEAEDLIADLRPTGEGDEQSVEKMIEEPEEGEAEVEEETTEQQVTPNLAMLWKTLGYLFVR